ncbi:MAG TPA: glycerol-3-phosphate 1-O-acyltransferase PlsY [Bryobacteraceae bacterium]|nr:glycerol-3-phosphate 1-O-acyltransferase PlsY [Bryobacteraceae bacterium]
MIPCAALAVAYLLGSIPFGYLLVRWKTGGDIRASGSGNIGATNVTRTTGRAAGLATLILDVAKGYLAVWLAGRFTGHDARWMSLAALAVMAGHAYPVWLRFKGGKAVASFYGAFLALTPLAVVAIFIVFVGVVAWTRYISLGSIIGAATFPLAVWLILQPAPPVVVAALMAGAFIVYKHRENMVRLHAGREHVFSLGGKRSQ